MSDIYLHGARAIAKELQRLGVIPEDAPNPEDAVYYLNRSGKLVLDRFGREFISTPSKLKLLIEKQVS